MSATWFWRGRGRADERPSAARKRNTVQLAVIVTLSGGEDDDEEGARLLGVRIGFTKPLGVEKLVATIRERGSWKKEPEEDGTRS